MPKHIYFAKGGEAAIMSELLCRGYNVAVPWVDFGDDMYVVEDARSNFIRVQVKAANCKKRKYGISGRVRVPLAQLQESKKTKLIYVFALRYSRQWKCVLVISREKLEEAVMKFDINRKHKNSRKKDEITFFFYVKPLQNRVTCYEQDFTQYLSWDKEFPVIKSQSAEG